MQYCGRCREGLYLSLIHILGRDLMDTLAANRAGCVGMAANMIGVKRRVIIVNMGLMDVVMFNPVLVRCV